MQHEFYRETYNSLSSFYMQSHIESQERGDYTGGDTEVI